MAVLIRLMPVVLVGLWAACTWTWGSPSLSSSPSSLPSSGHTVGACVRGVSASRETCSPLGMPRPTPCLVFKAVPVHFVYAFEVYVLVALAGSGVSRSVSVRRGAFLAVLRGLVHFEGALPRRGKAFLSVRLVRDGFAVAEVFWQLAWRQRGVAWVFSILIWALWPRHLSGCEFTCGCTDRSVRR